MVPGEGHQRRVSRTTSDQSVGVKIDCRLHENLQHIFIITSGHLPQFGPVRPYFSYPIKPKCRYFPKSRRGDEPWLPSRSNTYRLSNSCLRASFWESKIRRRWINIAFQTLSSTSCIRSTTIIANMLKPKIASLSENTF